MIQISKPKEISCSIRLKPYGSSMILIDSVETSHKFIFPFNKELFTEKGKMGEMKLPFHKIKEIVESYYIGFKLMGFSIEFEEIDNVFYSIPYSFHIQPIEEFETKKIGTINLIK